MFHDIGEMVTGDMPSYTKSDPTMRGRLHELEAEGHLAMMLPWALPPVVRLTPFQHWVFKLADRMELWESALQEFMMGNQFCAETAERVEADVEKMLFGRGPDYTAGELEVYDAATTYMKRRKSRWQRE